MSRPRLKPPWPKKAQNKQGADELRPPLEAARLDLRALYRALPACGWLKISQSSFASSKSWMPTSRKPCSCSTGHLSPPAGVDWRLMIGDTQASLQRLPAARAAFLATFDAETRLAIEERTRRMRDALLPEEVYLEIPARDPDARRS